MGISKEQPSTWQDILTKLFQMKNNIINNKCRLFFSISNQAFKLSLLDLIILLLFLGKLI